MGSRAGGIAALLEDQKSSSPSIDYRVHPELYRVGRGEQGVWHHEPYRSELAPLWRFKTPELARESSRALYAKFEEYLAQDDFPGADMARKFLQMGWTRARRYANHRDGRKYRPGTGEVLPLDPDSVKAESAAIFHELYERAWTNPRYQELRQRHERQYG